MEEAQMGAPNPQQAVLSTATLRAIPHARVVAIREITLDSLLFFTQRGTRKVKELEENRNAVITFWFELYQREVIIEGRVERLSDAENEHYWQTYPREAQLRFYAYAPTSSQPIPNKQALEVKKKSLEEEYKNKELPVSPYYCGFRLKPNKILFYTYRIDELSDVYQFCYEKETWSMKLLSP